MQIRIVLISFFVLICVQSNPKFYNAGFIFYDLESEKALLPPVIATGSFPSTLRQSIGQDCSCQMMTCGCCAAMSFDLFNFRQSMCTNMTYVPDQFGIQVAMLLNNRQLAERTISGSNPPPFCIPIKAIQLPIKPKVCVKLSDIRTSGRNIFFCMDWQMRALGYELFNVHFTCLQMGTNGIKVRKRPANKTSSSPSILTKKPFLASIVNNLNRN